MPRHLLQGVDVEQIAIVSKGANRKRWFLKKEESADLMELPHGRLVKAADWERIYCVVAEPGWEESPGRGPVDQSIPDVWASADEIRKAQRSFVVNGQKLNKLHTDIAPYGLVVENAIALDDFEVNGELIKKDSWYLAFEPTAEGREAIESGEFTGVSIQGTGHRTLVEKADEDHGHLDDLLLDKPTDKDGSCTLKKTAGSALPGLDRSPKKNWVDQVGGLPSLIDRAARHLHYERGRTISAAIATAVNWAKKMCATGTAFGGKVKVSAGAQARACEAVASWDAKKAKAKVTKQHVAKGETVYETEESVDELLAKGSSGSARSLGRVEGLLTKMARKLGISDEEVSAELEKGDPPTFAERIAQRELDDELPDAFQVLRSVIWSAYYPPPDSTADPKQLIEQSLDEFKTWALELLDRVPVNKAEEVLADSQIKASFATEVKKAEGSRQSEGTLEDMDDATREEIKKLVGESVAETLGDEEIVKSFMSNFRENTLGSTPTGKGKRVRGGGGTIAPRKVSVSSSKGSDRLRVKMHKAAEEAGVELSEETITKALEEFDAEGGLEVDLENEEAQEPSAEDLKKADERWEREREMLVKAGVPPAMVDSAEPILKREDADIEISDSQSIDAQKVVRDLLKEYEGTIDFSERGAHVVKGSERDEAREQAEAWSKHDRGAKSEAS